MKYFAGFGIMFLGVSLLPLAIYCSVYLERDMWVGVCLIFLVFLYSTGLQFLHRCLSVEQTAQEESLAQFRHGSGGATGESRILPFPPSASVPLPPPNHHRNSA